MITVSNVSLQFGKRTLFEDVNLKFTPGNCYGVIGANGAGKSTFLKLLSGELETTTGGISFGPGMRLSVLSQNHFEFDEHDVLTTVIMGNTEMYKIMVEKDAIYMNPDATEADGLRAAELENQFGEMGGWTAESDAGELLDNLGIGTDLHYKLMGELTGSQKVRVLLAQALLGDPDILMMDEPTNDLDAETIMWLEDFLADYQNIVIVVSHDRHFLDMVCTHMVDIDFKKIKIYAGNYTFWYEMSELIAKQRANKNKKNEQKRAEMQEFIARFSANASKSKQATSRKKALDKLTIEEMPHSSRRYPFINFKPERDPGNEILTVEGLSYTSPEGDLLFNDVHFKFEKGEKIALISREATTLTAFFDVLGGKVEATSGTFEFGQTMTPEYLPNDNTEFFSGSNDLNLIDWLRQYSQNKDEEFIRGFLGRMLFSGEDVMKQSSVLSGGEKVRCMLSKMMLQNPNFLILDEPTGHLDLESITAFNNALIEFPGNLIFTSHDNQFMTSVANRVVEITPKGMLDKLMPFEEYIKDEGIRKQREELYA